MRLQEIVVQHKIRDDRFNNAVSDCLSLVSTAIVT